VIKLAVRLAVGGGREPLVRLAVTALGVGMGAGLLLVAAVAYPALHAHDARAAWTSTAAHNAEPAPGQGTDPVLWRIRYDAYDGRAITWVDVAALGPHPPVPPGLRRLPGPGELAASPALRRLLRTAPARLLADRYPGRMVATVGDDALLGPGQLVLFAGHDPAELRGQPGVAEITSIESAPRAVALTRFGRVVVAIAVVALLVPILVLVATAARLAAARREQRLAALRLAGATPRQTRTLATVEAVLAATAGTALGFAVFAAARPYAARVDLDGSPFFPSDLRLSWGAAALVALGVPALAVAAALVSLRRVQVSPLGVSRRTVRGRPTWRRLVPLALGLAAFGASLPALATTEGDGAVVATFTIVGLIVAGIAIAGPWLTLTAGRVVGALARRPPALLAGRRLADSPAAGFRAISGLVLAVFVTTLVSEFVPAATAPYADSGDTVLPPGTVAALTMDDHRVGTVPPLAADRAAPLLASLARIHGVGRVIDLRVSGTAVPGRPPVLVTRCAGLRAARLATCPDPAATVAVAPRLDAKLLEVGPGTPPASQVPATALGTLPVAAILVTTDGRRSTVEAVRTALDPVTGATSGSTPLTTADVNADARRQVTELTRLGNAGLLVTLLIAGLSLAVSVAGGLLDRGRPFALLRLAGMRRRDLHRVLLIETAVPLFTVAVASVGLAMAVSGYVLWVLNQAWRLPQPAYWPTLAAGLLLALGVATSATMPMLNRITTRETARFE
jgi:hypothetical protein